MGAWLPNGFDTTPSLGITPADWGMVAVEIASAASVVPEEPEDPEDPTPTPPPTGGFAANEQNVHGLATLGRTQQNADGRRAIRQGTLR